MSDWRQIADEASGRIEAAALRELVRDLVAIPSFTGHERAICDHLTTRMSDAGLLARHLRIDDRQSSAVGTLAGAGARQLLLYAPIDSLLAGDPAEDLPVAGATHRPDMRPEPVDRGPLVVGLAASNPKGHAACVLAALEALAATGATLPGSVLAGFGGGGMPTNPPASESRGRVGHGVGVSFLLEQGVRPDAAVIAKPGRAVAHEEVGLCWFRLDVRGEHGYVGSRHRISGHSPILDLPTVIEELERWFASYTEQHTAGLVAPQGMIGAVEGGWPRSPSFSPSVTSLYIDLRISPRTTPAEARAAFDAAVGQIRRRHPDLDLAWDMLVGIPGTSTDPSHPVVRATIEAFEDQTGGPHRPQVGTSGATDANILRQGGVPTARVGMPKVSDPDGHEVDFELGMNAVDVDAMVELTRVLIHAACRYLAEG